MLGRRKPKTMKSILFIILGLFMITASFAQVGGYGSNKGLPALHSSAKVHDAVLFPNPVINDRLSISSEDAISGIEIMNVIGQTVYKMQNDNATKEVVVDMSICSPDMYLVKVKFTDNKYLIRKVLVK